ncbi:MAG: hypothetical protein PHQ59_04710 [Candidatus Daviesbacteria bacterium]|nr:hypothetical protein [Candidatus Daviesbacteria bacterium]
MPKLSFSGNPFARLFNQEKSNAKLAVSLFAVGLIVFLLVALLFSFKNSILERLFPKQKTQAAACTNHIEVPSNRGGFIFTGGDLEQAIATLGTSLYSTNDLNLGPKKSVFTIGKYTQNLGDPLGLRLLMENNLSNADFKGLPGQVPVGWTIADSAGSVFIDVEEVSKSTSSKGTSIKLTNNKDQSGTQISQAYKAPVKEGQFIIFGVWIKAPTSADAKVVIQNSQAPFNEFGAADLSNVKPNKWSYVMGYGKVPAGVSGFQLALTNIGKGSVVWYESASVVLLGDEQGQGLSDLVLSRCGAVWMVDDGMGFEQTYSEPFMNPVSLDIYALLYHQFYIKIKSIDPSAKVLPGGIMGSPVVFDAKNGYSPKRTLDTFRASYKTFFEVEPPIDILAVRYLATDQKQWSGSKDLENYLTNVRNYMDAVIGWKGVPIWISRLGVSKNAPNEGVDFAQAAMKYLTSNKLNVEKWFWTDTCGANPQLVGLFESNNKICYWPMKLNALGQAYLVANITPTPTTTATVAPTLTATSSANATSSATPSPTSVVKTSTSSATIESTTSGGTQ